MVVNNVALLTGLDIVTSVGLPGQGNVATAQLHFSTSSYSATVINVVAQKNSRVPVPCVAGLELYEVFPGRGPVSSTECA